ncbi:MAG: diguanylate cyclase, partial [Mesorhizobium sp.]
LPIDCLPADHRCTASFGVAELQPGEGFADLMRRADEALYQAKRGGRDRVRISLGPALQTPVATPERISGRG